MSRVDVKTKDTILMLKNQINIKRQNIDWEYIEGISRDNYRKRTKMDMKKDIMKDMMILLRD